MRRRKPRPDQSRYPQCREALTGFCSFDRFALATAESRAMDLRPLEVFLPAHGRRRTVEIYHLAFWCAADQCYDCRVLRVRDRCPLLEELSVFIN